MAFPPTSFSSSCHQPHAATAAAAAAAAAAAGMAYFKASHYPVNGIGLTGPGMDLLHSSVGYPGKFTFDCKHNCVSHEIHRRQRLSRSLSGYSSVTRVTDD